MGISILLLDQSFIRLSGWGRRIDRTLTSLSKLQEPSGLKLLPGQDFWLWSLVHRTSQEYVEQKSSKLLHRACLAEVVIFHGLVAAVFDPSSRLLNGSFLFRCAVGFSTKYWVYEECEADRLSQFMGHWGSRRLHQILWRELHIFRDPRLPTQYGT